MKRIIVLAIVFVGLAAFTAAILPQFLSTERIRQQIADEIADLTGRTVALEGDASLSVYPQLAVSIGDLTIANREGMGEDAFITAQGLTTRLRLWPLFLGRVEFDEFELVRPRIHLVVDADRRANWLMPKLSGDDAPRLAGLAIGRLKISDGTIVYDNLVRDQHEEMTGLGLDVAWPRAGAPIGATGTLQWRGETVEFNGFVAKPLEVAAGGRSPARFAVAATPLRISFNGTLINLDGPQFSGDGSLTTPSMRRTIEWLGTRTGSGSILGAGSIKGTAEWSGAVISFADATVELDGNTAAGVLSVNFVGERPSIHGALDFAKLDLSPYLDAIRADIIANGPWLTGQTRLPIADAIDADLRLSASNVIAGRLRTGNTAVAVTIRQRRITANVGEAQFYGGRLEGEVTAAMSGGALRSSLRAKVTAVPTRVALADLIGIDTLDGSVDASAELSARGGVWGELIDGLSGTARIALSGGSLAGIDVKAIGTSLTDLHDETAGAGAGATAFTSLSGTFAIGGGAFTTDDLAVEGQDYRIAVAGQGSVFSGRIALRATLATVDASGREGTLPLRVSGTLRAPEFALDRERVDNGGGLTGG
ncbi:MAG: AsmA family protein [Bauldia sp.]